MDENSNIWLTTIDNPFDPFSNFDEWNLFDVSKGYNSCAYIARIAQTSDELSETDYNLEFERAIDEIIKFDPLKIYKKITQKQ